MRFLPDDRPVVAAVIGMGYVGSCIAATLVDNGVDVIGVDVDARLVDELNDGHCRFSEPGLADLLFRAAGTPRLRFTTDVAAVPDADVVIVAVGTPIRDGGVLRDVQLRGACEELSRHLRAGQLVIFKSTLPPGGTRRLAVPLLQAGGLVCGQDIGVAFCPERLSEGEALRELNSFPIVVGGINDASADAAAAFWQRSLRVEVIRSASLEAAELVKLADNWWIDHNIALANELAKLCGPLDVDVLDVIAAANSISKGSGKVNILLPSVGVGGSCLTKDPWMVWRAASDLGVELRTIPVARAVNDGMPAYTIDLIARELAVAGRVPAGSKVAVLGLAFKNNTGDLRATPTLPVVRGLRDAGCEVSVHDPLVDPDEAEKMFGLVPAASVVDAVRGADCVAVLAWHRELHGIDFAALREVVADRCSIVDGRAYFPPDRIESLRRLGYGYRGIGR